MTKSKREKIKRKILDSLNKAELSNNRGIFERSKYIKPNKKIRRHSGRRYTKIFGPQRILDEEGIFVDYYWDDWADYRDGWRHNGNMTHLFKNGRGCSCMSPEEIEESNKKIKKQIAIRKAKKRKNKEFN